MKTPYAIAMRSSRAMTACAGVVICPSGCFLSSLISDFPKNILVPNHPKSLLELSHPTPPEGRIAIVTDAGWGAVDAAASGAQRDAGRVGERPVSSQTA